tara:strand:- start:808 stop:957 length:150 start_codon:yes stop_codon:yes gene_type:complete
MVMVHRLFFGQATIPSIRMKWLTDYSEIPRINIPLKMLRMPVGRDCKCG